ncbi:MAG: 2-hydroxyacyl-CoA dehydratase family protein [Azospirillaceae bacterium]
MNVGAQGQALAACHDLLSHPEASARRHKDAGGRVVGYLGGTVPVEAITAAGLFPMRLRGQPGLATEAADRYMEPVREGYLRSILARLLAGHFDFLDLVVVPRSSEGLLQFYYLVQHIRAERPDLDLPPLHLFDLLQTPFDYTARYVRARLVELVDCLSMLANRSVGEEELSRAIARHDTARQSFGAFTERRRGRGSGISGVDSLAVAASGQLSDVDTFNDLLGQLRDWRPEGPSLPRLLVKGMSQENPAFYRAVEQAGARIVADDHDWGERLYDHPVGPDGNHDDDPLDALTAHCRHHTPGPRLLPQAADDARFLAMVEAAAVDGVIFCLEEHDDTLGWDYPAQRRMLAERGIAQLLVTGRSFFDDDRPPEAVSQFVAGLRDRADAEADRG